MRIGWVGKVVLAAAGPLLLGSSIFGWIMLQSVRDLERSRIEELLRSEAMVLASVLRDWEMEPAALAARVRRLADDVGIRITIVGDDGRVWADSAHDNVSAMENHGARPEVREAKETGEVALRTRYSETLGRDLLYAAARIGSSGAVVRVARDDRGVQAELARATGAVWVLLGSLILFCVGAAVLFARRVARPVEELTRIAQAVEAGDLAARVRPRGKDELSALGHSFNRMTEQLALSLRSARSEAARLTTLLEGMSEGVLAIDADSRVSFLNGRARVLLGLRDAAGVEGRPVLELVRDPRILALARRAPSEAEIVQDGPPRRILLVHARPVGGAGSDTILVIRDLSHMRRLERMRSDFVSNVSHELRTPLASLAAAVETLEDEDARADPETGARFVAMMGRNVRRLDALLNDILALSRLESRPETTGSPDVNMDAPGQFEIETERPRRGVPRDGTLR